MQSRTSPYLSVGKVARMCGVSNRTVLNWIRKDKIEAHALPSGHFRVHVDEVRAFMSANQMELPARLSEAAAIQDTLCWARRDLTASHDCARCGVLAAQAWHCFVARKQLGEGMLGCGCSCAQCKYYRQVILPLGTSLELDSQACAVSRGGVLLGANSQFAALLRRSQPELVGVSWTELVEADDPTLLFAVAHDLAGGEAARPRRGQAILLRKDGGRLDAELRVAPYLRLWGALMVRVGPLW